MRAPAPQRPSWFSTSAHLTTRRTRRATASSGTMRRLSTRAAWLSSKCPVAASAPARASNSSTRSSTARSPGAGAARPRTISQRWSARAAPPPRLQRVTARLRPRLPAVPTARRGAPARRPTSRGRRVPLRSVRARRVATRPASPRRRHGEPAGAGSGTGAGRRWAGPGRSRAARRAPPALRPRSSPPRPPRARARTGCRRRRRPGAPAGRLRSRVPTPPQAPQRRRPAPGSRQASAPRRRWTRHDRRGRANARAARGRTGCRRSPRTAPPSPRRRRIRPAASAHRRA